MSPTSYQTAPPRGELLILAHSSRPTKISDGTLTSEYRGLVSDVRAHVVEAELALGEGCDPAAVGAAVTVELCGHWEHDGPCRWPHNNAIVAGESEGTALFRTLFVASADEAPTLAKRIGDVLRGASGWRVLGLAPRAVAPDETGLAERLTTGPRAEV
jgi:hypothetical protein